MPTHLEVEPDVLGVLFDSNPLPMAMVHAETLQFFAVNDAALSAYRYTRDDFLRLTALTLQPAEQRAEFLAWWVAGKATLGSALRTDGSWNYLRSDGSFIAVDVERSRQFVYRKRPAYLMVFFDVSERTHAAEVTHANTVLRETADDVTGNETFSLDLRTGEQQNPSVGGPLMVRPAEDAGIDSNPDLAQDDVPQSIADRRPFESDYTGGTGEDTRWFHSGTQLVYGEDGVPTHIVGVTADVTERRSIADQLLAHAYRDVQTGLPNREAMLHDGVTLPESTTGLLLLHTHVVTGCSERDHDQKTRVMQEAARVIAAASPGATVARYADEVFAVITAHRGRSRSIVPLAKMLLASFEHPLRIGEDETVVIPSIGIAEERGRHHDASLLFREAECALEVARHDDAHLAVYDQVLADSVDRRATIEKYLRYAISRHRIGVAYQPIVSLSSGRIVGAEALMRWDCPGIGDVPPSEFIEVAEQSGSILKLGEWIMHEACAQARRWQLAGHALRIAVNVSGRQVKERDFFRIVTTACEEAELDPALLELELTESTMMRYDGMALRNLQAVRRLGVRISIDDFGTGYSSLSYLKNLPLDTLKIDRSFTATIPAGGFQAEVTRSVISLAHRRGLYVVGEGVESFEQLEMLRAMDCDEAQGYLMSRPVGEADFLGCLTRGRLGSLFDLPRNARTA